MISPCENLGFAGKFGGMSYEPVRFATHADGVAYINGDLSRGIKRGQEGYNEASFEELIIWEKDIMRVPINPEVVAQ